MVRRAKTTKIAKPVVRGQKVSHPAASAKRPAKKAGRSTKGALSSASPKRTAPIAPSAPELSKEELRTQVAKLERSNANLRVKNREASREAKTTAARIAELEQQVARFENQLAPQAAEPAEDRAALAPAGRRTRHREIDSSDSVPQSVAVEEPVPLDMEAETALASLEEHLGEEIPVDLEDVNALANPKEASALANPEEHLGEEIPVDLEAASALVNLEEASALANPEEHLGEEIPVDLTSEAARVSPEEHLGGD